MKYPILVRGIALAAALGAGGLLAQTRPAVPDNGPMPAVVTDAGPAPAQERESLGAIVLGNSLVRAQHQHAFEQDAARTGIASVGRAVLRATKQAQTQAELARAREDEAVELDRRGAAGLIEK